MTERIETSGTFDQATILGTREHAELLTKDRDPGVRDALQWLAFSHLPLVLRAYSRPFYQTAVELVVTITTDSPELTTALNRLVEAKDWAVRAGTKGDTGRAGPVPRPATVVHPPFLDKVDPSQPYPSPIRDIPQA